MALLLNSKAIFTHEFVTQMGDFSFDTKENSEILIKSISKTMDFATFSNRFKMLEKDQNNTEAVTWFKYFFEFVKNSAK